jgi:outer membrane protein assembly factor BamB
MPFWEGAMPLPSRFRRLVIFIFLLPLGLAITAAANPAAVASQWPQFGQTARHLNTNPDERAFNIGNVRQLKTAFTDVFGSSVNTEGGPAVANGVMYITDFNGNLSAFSTAGCGVIACKPLWTGHTDNDITSTPAVAGGLVLIGSADHFLYAFKAAGCGAVTCPPVWRGQLASAVIDSSVAVADGVAYVGDFDGNLYAFTAAGCGRALCAPLWVGKGMAGELIGAPAVGNGFVYVSTFISTPDLVTGRMLVFSTTACPSRKCAPLWTADLGGPAGRTGSPTISGNTVFVTSTTLFGNGTNTDFHLLAFAAGGCGAKVCKPLRTYDTGDGGVDSTPAVAGGIVYATTQASPDPNTIGVVAAYPAAGCGRPQCEPLWTGVNFAAGFASAPSVVNGVVFVGKGPASGFPVDAGVYAFNAAGCGTAVCQPISFLQLGEEQNFLGAPLAVAEGKLFMVTNDNSDNTSKVYVLTVPGA